MTQDELKLILHYDLNTGEFTWIQSGFKRTVGSRAGYQHKNGYRIISINYKLYREHRLAWLYVYGYLPILQLDHRDRNRSNNCIDNLREATATQNGQNRSRMKNNTSGFNGVTFNKKSSKWLSRITINGKLLYLGLFKTPDEAHLAYLKAKAELHTFQPT
jgi:hypothetical protein